MSEDDLSVITIRETLKQDPVLYEINVEVVGVLQ